MSELGLTYDEHHAMDLTRVLTNVVCQKVIGDGETREADINEFVAKIHAIQHMILSQAAGRAHPELYRNLGGVIE